MPRTFHFLLVVSLFSSSLLASDAPPKFVAKGTKIARILKWFEKGSCPNLVDIETMARAEVDVAEQYKQAGYTVPEGADKWNKLAVLRGTCSTTDKPDLLTSGSLHLKNFIDEKGKAGTYVFPTWDREADSSALLYNPLQILTDLSDFGPGLGVTFKQIIGTDKREYRTSAIIADTSVLVDAVTFSTKYVETDSSPFQHDHKLLYELRKIATEQKTYYALKEILETTDFSNEKSNVGRTTRACLFEVAN